MVSRHPPVRVITATAIFDGHDVSINIIRRKLQDRGVEVIHLGHNRGVDELVNAALQEDVDAVCISSYQGGHIEYFEYLLKQLKLQAAGHILVFAGGGGTISEEDAGRLMKAGVRSVYTSKNSLHLGLDGIADEIVECCLSKKILPAAPTGKNYELAKRLTECQNNAKTSFTRAKLKTKVIGVTGTGGAGKSTLIDDVLSVLLNNSELNIACIAIDPSRQKTGGALLGDRIRINSACHSRLYFRSIATRQENTSITPVLNNFLHIMDEYSFDLIVVETSGIGQSDKQIYDYVDHAVYVMTSDYGAPGQLEKISMLDYADSIVLNKYDHQGSKDALKAIKKQWRSNHQSLSGQLLEEPVFPVRANYFEDPGLHEYVIYLCAELFPELSFSIDSYKSHKGFNYDFDKVIPSARQNYLGEISKHARLLKKYNQQQCDSVEKIQHIYEALAILEEEKEYHVFNDEDQSDNRDNDLVKELKKLLHKESLKVDSLSSELLEQWEDKRKSMLADYSVYTLRNKTLKHTNYVTSLSDNKISVISPADYSSWKDQLKFLLNENVPGSFPYTSGVYPYRNTEEDPARMFAGEGAPEDTNRRFFLLKNEQKSIRLSTAFDPLVLYAKDPQSKPDIYGCIGMSGVSISTLDDMKKLYSGIDLCDDNTSVSMTINGPASILMAFFLLTAIDQQVELYLKEKGVWDEVQLKIGEIFKDSIQPCYSGELPEGHNRLGLGLLGVDSSQLIEPEVYRKISDDCCKKLRGTLQADILKEEQAQNECIYSLEFSLKLMADIQKYFIRHNVKNFYSVSVSGYHIAEAGANPVTQLAFTLANGFTLLEYYLSQGMDIDEFASQFSFFFSNGMDAEYAVIGRVARRIWARALKYEYKASERSQKLKYHIQTSGRSLQAQDIQLNDIRTCLQALYAVYDNCNSLHTNAYDEAVTTPTDESARRALAIQLIINRELGLNVNQNPLQGSFLINELTDLVEQAVYDEFDRLSERGGVIGAMEYFYQRNKIQEESAYAENLKQSGDTAIIGVNQFVKDENNGTGFVSKFIHSSSDQKNQQIKSCKEFKKAHESTSEMVLKELSETVVSGENSFEAIIKACRSCSLQQISDTLVSIGGQYRRLL